jgi:pimeloyl-ACP methyl ester carboxylesterase
VEAAATEIPWLPPGRAIELPGRGRTFVRELGERAPGVPSLVLLHGWMATADLNWFPSYAPLADAGHHVIAIDHRGHGRGLRSPERFSLAGCADDAAAVAGVLGIDGVVPVGYSMGGLVAQVMWRRHRDLVRGLVLCATSRNFRGSAGDHIYFGGLSGLALAARRAPGPLREQAFARLLANRLDSLDLTPWGAAEIARHDFRSLMEAGASIGKFSSHRWIGEVDVPTAVVVTTADTKVPPPRQVKLAQAIPGCVTFEVDGDHHVCSRQPDRFVPALLAACESVRSRCRSGPRSAG